MFITEVWWFFYVPLMVLLAIGNVVQVCVIEDRKRKVLSIFQTVIFFFTFLTFSYFSTFQYWDWLKATQGITTLLFIVCVVIEHVAYAKTPEEDKRKFDILIILTNWIVVVGSILFLMDIL
jgi:hypothetical protein